MFGKRVRMLCKGISVVAICLACAGVPAFSTTAFAQTAEEAVAALRRGEQALRSLDYNLAVSELNTAVSGDKLEPHNRAVALLNRGLSRQNLQDAAGSIKDYSEAIQIGTLPVAARAIAHFNRGLAHNTVGQTTLALDDLSTAIKINGAFSQAYNSRATLMRMLGRHQSAIRDYHLAIKYRYPQPHLAHYGAALAHISLRQVNDAKRELNLAIKTRPGFKLARDKMSEIGGTVEIDKTSVIEVASADPTITNGIKRTPEKIETTIEPAAAPRVPVGSYLVQLMAQNNHQAVKRMWSKISTRHASVLNGMEPIIQKADLGSRVVYRLRMGPFSDRASADRLCRRLKKRGQDCFTTAAK